jgi:hypothetical protein
MWHVTYSFEPVLPCQLLRLAVLRQPLAKLTKATKQTKLMSAAGISMGFSSNASLGAFWWMQEQL